MPVRGAKPKPFAQTRHRNKPAHDWAEVVDEPFAGAPHLPAKMPNGLVWPSTTRRWWKTVSSMPHCSLWAKSDWAFALDTAYVAALFHLGGSNVYAAELRNRERVLGTTSDFRRDLRIRYVPAASASPLASVANLDQYRDL